MSAGALALIASFLLGIDPRIMLADVFLVQIPYSASGLLTSQLPSVMATHSVVVRIFLIGLLLQIIPPFGTPAAFPNRRRRY